MDHIWDLPDEDYQAVMNTVLEVGRRLRKAFPDKKRIGIIVEGFEVPHAHVKVFPVDNEREMRAYPNIPNLTTPH